MSALIEPFIAGLRSVVASALPAVLPNGIWEAEHAAMIPHQPPFSAQTNTINLPAAFIVANDFTESDDWGGDNDVWEGPVTLYVVAEVDGDSSALRVYMEALKDYIRHNDLPLGQVIRFPGRVAYRLDEEPNITFYAQNATQRAGWITLWCLLGESAN